MATRKITKFQVCANHAWIDTERRERRAQVFGEGGPGSGPPCESSKPCRMWPGTDLFIPEVCESEMDLDWAVNQRSVEAAGLER